MNGSIEDGQEQPLPKLQGGRELGAWASVYHTSAKVWIYIELVYLLILLIVALVTLAACGIAQTAPEEAGSLRAWLPEGVAPAVYLWPAILASGLAGGTMIALKWHYHCVAKKLWHADRRVWRITSPLLSGVLALFVIMLIRSNILSILRADVLSTFSSSVASAFLLGLFSDNLLAALQNFANAAFGTLKDTRARGSDQPPDGEA